MNSVKNICKKKLSLQDASFFDLSKT